MFEVRLAQQRARRVRSLEGIRKRLHDIHGVPQRYGLVGFYRRGDEQALKEAQLEFERPLTRLLQRLHFVEDNEEEASAKQVSAFVTANKPLLKELQVDLSSIARKTLVPKLVPAIVRTPVSHPWVPAPPKALLPPTAAAALMPPPPPPPPPERANSPGTQRPSTTKETAAEVASSNESLSEKVPKKKTRGAGRPSTSA